MKKRILGTVIITVIALAAGWNFNQNENEVTISELTLDNIEALAQPEGLPGYEYVELKWEGGMGGFLTKVCTGVGSKIC